MAEVVEEVAVALPKAVEASKAEVVEDLVEEAVEAFKAEEEEALVEEAVEVFKAVVVVAAATEVAEVISFKTETKVPHFSESFCCKLTLPRYFNLCFCTT